MFCFKNYLRKGLEDDFCVRVSTVIRTSVVFFCPQNGEFDDNANPTLPDGFSLIVKLSHRAGCCDKLLLIWSQGNPNI